MDAKLENIEAKLDRILSILDAKCAKQKCDRDRIKSKRDEDAAEEARKRGAIVVDRLTGTFHRALQKVGLHRQRARLLALGGQ